MKVYISGPVTGKEGYMDHFLDAQMDLEGQGFSVVNPAAVIGKMPKETSYEECMRMSMTMLDMCEVIYMLKGWEKSCGANREYGYALGRGMKIMLEE